MPAAPDLAQDLSVRPRGGATSIEPEAEGAQSAMAAQTPERASGLLGASATTPDVVARAHMSVAIQQSVGNARMAALFEPLAPVSPPSGVAPMPASPAPPAPAPPALAPQAAPAPPPAVVPAPMRESTPAPRPAPSPAETPASAARTAKPTTTPAEPPPSPVLAPTPVPAAPPSLPPAAPAAVPAPAPPLEPVLESAPELPVTAAPAEAAPESKKKAAPESATAASPATEAAAEAPTAAAPSRAPAMTAARKGATAGAAAGEGEAGAPAEAAEGEAVEAGGPGKKAGGGRSVVMKMPEAPTDLTPAAKARVQGASSRAGKTASANAALPPAPTQVGQARGAVTEPSQETNARAAQGVVTALGQRPAPSPQVEALCFQIYWIIKSKRPPDEEKLVKADPEAMGKEAGGTLKGNVQTGTQQVNQGYTDLNKTPAGTPQQQGKPIDPVGAAAPAPAINAAQATPDAVPAKNVSLDEDAADTKAKAQAAGMDTEPAKLVKTGPIADARDAQGELDQTAKEDPAKVLADQQASLVKAGADMAALQQKAVEALNASRQSTVASTGARQTKMVGSEESMRAKVSADAQAIFTSAQNRVNEQLQPLPKIAMDKWDAGVKVASERFKQHLQKVENWIKDRHSGGWGSVVSLWDDITGLPGWVTDEYDAAEQKFGDEICALAREISSDVNGVIMICEGIIANARSEIAALFASLPANLQTWALGEQTKFGQQLDALHGKAIEVRENFTKDLVNRAGQAVDDVREQVHALREKAKGLIGKVLNAIDRFIEDPAKFILEGLLELLGIPPASFWAVVAKIQQVISDIADDPMKFANNLMAAVGQGFQQFFDNILDHLLRGFIDWLTGGLAAAGVQLPKDLSPKSLITFFLQLMGITWPRIRKLLVKHIGAENVALIEKAYSIVANLVALGPEGVFEMIKEKLNPKTILDQIIRAAVDYLVKAVVKAVTARILLLFNPAGAILQALEAIYRVLKWIFTNAARIFRLIETIVNGIADIIAGSIGGMANAVESALGGLVAPVIDFLAEYLGFGDLPDKIRDTIIGFQEWVEGILDEVIGWLVEKGKALLTAVGLGGDDKDKKKKDGDEPNVGEHVPFTAAGEGHELWIDVEGTTAEPMVASAEKMTVEKRLDTWEAKAKDLSKKPKKGESESAKDKAERLIGEARSLEVETDKTAEEIVRESQKANEEESAEAPDNSDTTELTAEEQQLAGILQQLFELFGESFDKPSERWKDDLDKMQGFAKTWASKEVDANEAEVTAFDEWSQVRDWLEARPALANPLSGDLEDDFWKKVAGSGNTIVGKGLAAQFTDPSSFGLDEKAALTTEVAQGGVSDLKGRLLRWACEGKDMNAAASIKDFVKDLDSSKISNETGATKTSWYHEWGKWNGSDLEYAYPKHVSWKDKEDLSSKAWDTQQHHVWPRYLMGPDILVGIKQKLHIVHFHNGVQYPLFAALQFPKSSGPVRAQYQAAALKGQGSAFVTTIRNGLTQAYVDFEAQHCVNSGFAAHCGNIVANIPEADLKT